MLISEAKRRTNAKFDKENTKKITMKLNIHTDADLIEHLAKQENVQGYLKKLIREDMRRNEK